MQKIIFLILISFIGNAVFAVNSGPCDQLLYAKNNFVNDDLNWKISTKNLNAHFEINKDDRLFSGDAEIICNDSHIQFNFKSGGNIRGNIYGELVAYGNKIQGIKDVDGVVTYANKIKFNLPDKFQVE